MKFNFFSTMEGSPWGGSEDLWSKAAWQLLDQGHVVSCCIRDWAQAEAAPLRALEAHGAKVYRRHPPAPLTTVTLVRQKIAGRLGLLRPAMSASDAFAAQAGDITLVNLAGDFPAPFVCDSIIRSGVPYVILVQAASEHWWPDDDTRLRSIALFNGARAVLFVSDGNRRLISRQLAYEHPRTLVVRNPFRVAYDEPLPWPKLSTTLNLAFVGRLDPEAKGCDLALEALARLTCKKRDLTLTFFGEGRCKEGTRALAAQLGLGNRVRFAGHISNVTSIWIDHHALLLPSRYEGMPLAIIEAMLCGRPCITTDIAGNAEFVIENRTGFLAESATIEAVGCALERAYAARNRWSELGSEAASTVRRLIPPSPPLELAKLLLKLAEEK